MVGDEDADVALGEGFDDVLDVLHGDGVDAGEGFVEEEEHGVVGQSAGNLGAAAFAAGELDALAVAYVLEAELVEERLELGLLLVGGEVLAELEDGHDVVGHSHLAKDGGLLGEVSHTHLRAAVHGVACELDGHLCLRGDAFGEGAAVLAVAEEYGAAVAFLDGLVVAVALAGGAALGGEVDLAAEGFDDAHHHVEGGGLAGAVGAEEAHNLALSHLDGGALDDGALAVGLHYVVCVEFH